METRWKWNNIFKVLKEKNSQPRTLYLVKISFKSAGNIKKFSGEQEHRNSLSEACTKIIFKGSSSGEIKLYQKRTWNIRNEEKISTWLNKIHYSFPILFFKKCLMIENKNYNMSDGVFYVGRYINSEEK